MTAVPSRHELAVVLDFGAQYVQLIVRKVREQNVYCEIRPCTLPVAELVALRPKAVILSGGPASVYGEGAPSVDPALFHAGLPTLGICYGHQLMAHLLGGTVEPGRTREFGLARLRVEEDSTDGLFTGVEREPTCWMSHGDHVTAPPTGFRRLAVSSDGILAAMGDPERHLYGVQFHPEVTHTPFGPTLLRNFLYRAAGCRGDWRSADFVEEAVAAIRETVGDGRILCAMSGGVDSAVVATLARRAVGDRAVCMFIDTGLMRLGEPEQVKATFGQLLGDSFVAVKASDHFLGKLAGLTDPERKRKVVGETFIRVFEAECEKLGEFQFIAHGTLYPDVIESGGGATARIKSHHNVEGLPDDMRLINVEPLRLLFKDEVRQVALALGLPEAIAYRQPFPGPGFAVRVNGEVTPEKLDIAKRADAIVREEIEAAGLDREVSQYLAALPDVRTVGVLGDDRVHGYPVVVRAVVTHDFMTADWARIPHDTLARIATRIVNEVRGVSRVLYDVTTKPPATIEWE
ncbi:MAG: glutamine-hydrolyzing GMP synthase [Armatimonadetes bacterium]|nr:glutamine-hydrolyzing GMP synthase [Armatimonadota bacterium]